MSIMKASVLAVKDEIQLLEESDIEVSTAGTQLCILKDFLQFIGFNLYYNVQSVWHIKDNRPDSPTKGSLFMKFQDAIQIYNGDCCVHKLVYLYDLDLGLLRYYHKNIKPVDRLKIARHEGGIIATGNFLKFINRENK